MASVRVVTVDDQETFRRAAEDLIRHTPHFEFAGEAACGLDALETVASTRPQLVLLDVRMPGIDGIETARRIRARHPDVVVVLVSAEDPEDLAPDVSGCGAAALIAKHELCPRRLAQLWTSAAG